MREARKWWWWWWWWCRGFLWLRLTVSRPKGSLGEREVQAAMGRCRFDLDTDQRRLEGCMWCLYSKEESHAFPSI